MTTRDRAIRSFFKGKQTRAQQNLFACDVLQTSLQEHLDTLVASKEEIDVALKKDVLSDGGAVHAAMLQGDWRFRENLTQKSISIDTECASVNGSLSQAEATGHAEYRQLESTTRILRSLSRFHFADKE